jgi:nitrite reductase/ring-hydroxylating ferredoxin subunit
MKKTFSILSILTLLIFSNLSINSCGSTDDTVSCFPNTPINVTLNLNLPAYNALNQVGGWIYVNEQQSGTRGLIVVRASDTSFKVYDRNAPHICPDSNTTLEVKDNISIICPKDNATWILITGQPTAGSSLPPKTYPSNYDPSGKILTVYF